MECGSKYTHYRFLLKSRPVQSFPPSFLDSIGCVQIHSHNIYTLQVPIEYFLFFTFTDYVQVLKPIVTQQKGRVIVPLKYVYDTQYVSCIGSKVMYILCYARIIPFIIGMNRNTHTVPSPVVSEMDYIFLLYLLCTNVVRATFERTMECIKKNKILRQVPRISRSYYLNFSVHILYMNAQV